MVSSNLARYFWYGAGIFLVNLILKFWFLTANDIGHDEPFTLFFAQGSPGEIIENLIPYNNPPLYELLLHYWISIFGIDPLAARMFPCLISCLSAVLLFVFVRKIWNEKVAWFSVLFFTFSTYQISFSHEVRTYSLFFLLTVCSMYFFTVMLTSGRGRMLYILFTLLLLYCHFFSLWIIGIQLIILTYHKRILERKVVVSLVVLLIGFSPYLWILFQRFGESAEKGTWLEPPTISALYENIRHFSNQPVTAVLVLLTMGFGIVQFLRKRMQPAYFGWILFWFFVPYFVLFLLSFSIPMFLGRYLIFITPAFIILLALVSVFIWEEKGKIKWLALLLPAAFITTVNLNPLSEQEPAKVAKMIKPYYDRTVMIIVSPKALDLQINYHLDRELFSYDPDYREREMKRNIIPEDNVKNIRLPDELIFVETKGGGYLDKERNNFDYLCAEYEIMEELKYEGKEVKAFSIFHFKNRKN